MRGKNTLKKLPVAAAAAILGMTLTTASTRAADPNFCHDYAAAAMWQVHAAISVPPCRGGMNGPRWADAFQVHYDWCLRVPFEAANNERDARQRYLQACW